jgi:hypothetical protein
MSVVLQFSAEEETKALPILLRHSPGTILPDRTYLVDESLLSVLRDANVTFREATPRLFGGAE